jgi:sugar lactone lactonase YvrE
MPTYLATYLIILLCLVFQAIKVPHDIAISKDGSSLYVASIDPNRIMKYTMAPVTPLKSE